MCLCRPNGLIYNTKKLHALFMTSSSRKRLWSRAACRPDVRVQIFRHKASPIKTSESIFAANFANLHGFFWANSRQLVKFAAKISRPVHQLADGLQNRDLLIIHTGARTLVRQNHAD